MEETGKDVGSVEPAFNLKSTETVFGIRLANKITEDTLDSIPVKEPSEREKLEHSLASISEAVGEIINISLAEKPNLMGDLSWSLGEGAGNFGRLTAEETALVKQYALIQILYDIPRVPFYELSQVYKQNIASVVQKGAHSVFTNELNRIRKQGPTDTNMYAFRLEVLEKIVSGLLKGPTNANAVYQDIQRVPFYWTKPRRDRLDDLVDYVQEREHGRESKPMHEWSDEELKEAGFHRVAREDREVKTRNILNSNPALSLRVAGAISSIKEIIGADKFPEKPKK